MSTTVRRLAFGSLILAGLALGQGAGRAQFVTGFNSNAGGYNPYMAQQQYMYNLQMARGASANSMGFANPSLALPYAQPGYNPYSSYGVNPYSTLPPTYGAGGANPYMPYGGASSALNPYAGGMMNPYLYNPYSGLYNSPGFTLMGSADVMRAYGSVINKQEEARITREKYYQEQVKTQKDKFDLRMYIKANTPSWTDQQLAAAKTTLKRIQNMSSPVEVSAGKSLNYLLDDVRKYRGKEFSFSKIDLPDDILSHLNITSNANGLGLLRDGGKLNWPTALLDFAPANVRKEMDARAQAIVQNASKGMIDRNAINDLGTQVEALRTQLLKKANEVPTQQYLDAKRFLNDLDDSRAAVASGEAKAQFEFQNLVKEGKVNDVADLIKTMVDRGWRFAPATGSDEAAYRALHSALAAYDVALNSHTAE